MTYENVLGLVHSTSLLYSMFSYTASSPVKRLSTSLVSRSERSYLTAFCHTDSDVISDRIWMKGLVRTLAMFFRGRYRWTLQVVLVVLLDTLNSCFDIISVYQPLVMSFGNYDAVLTTHWGKR